MKPYYHDNHNTLYSQDFRTNDLPDEYVQMVCTSPPYWGLRKYSGEQDLIWGDNHCEHEWLDYNARTYQQGQGMDELAKAWKTGGKPKAGNSELSDGDKHKLSHCSVCGAWRGAFGLEPTPEMYVQHTIEILREIRRVLRKDGVVFWNIGDSYGSGKGTCFNPGGGKGSFSGHGDRKDAGAYPLDRGNISMLKASGLKPKDLCLIPFRVAIAAQEDGWWVRSIIIWNKPNPMPESVTDRPTESHEYILMLTQSGKSLCWTHRNQEGTREKPKADYRWVNQITSDEVAVAPQDWKVKIKCPGCEATGIINVHLGLDVWQEAKCPTCNGKKETQLWKRINLWQGHDYYWDADAVRTGYQQSSIDRANGSKVTTSNPDRPVGFTRDLGSGSNLRTVWSFPTQPYPEAHFAVFPEKLPELCIKAATPEVGCCSKCGAPWVRILEKKPSAFNIRVRDAKAGRATPEEGYKATQDEIDNYPGNHPDPGYRQTIGWQPTCKCNADKVPSIVLDPFAGAGTTLWVAKKLNRRAIGFDISEEYCQLAVERCRQQVLL